MEDPTVYLCGTITRDPKFLNWRREAEEKLEAWGIRSLSPVRGKNPDDWKANGLDTDKPRIPGGGYARPVIYSNGGFVPRDKYDVKRCDAVLLAFWEAPDRQSIGTWWEAGWASAWDKPIVVCSQLPEVVEHPFVWRQVARICPTLDEGIEYLAFLLSNRWNDGHTTIDDRAQEAVKGL